MKYRVKVVYLKKSDELIETPDEDEILEASQYRAFLDFMKDQGFELILSDEAAGRWEDGLTDVILTYELSDMASKEIERVE